ncbi:MAG: cyclopropane-fatty-acyl-phospholipid synthase [Caulobacter sp.]|nr:cyclopropane-fatty-acyl-phospholipid synthase [Caulobacter sp.]
MASLADRQIDAARAIIPLIAEHLKGDLSIRLWNGDVLPLGEGARSDLCITIKSPNTARRLMTKPGLMTVFELFASGDIGVEGGSPVDAADRLEHQNVVRLAKRVDKWKLARMAWPFLLAREPTAEQLAAFDTSRVAAAFEGGRNDKDLIDFHYDVSNAFYAMFLDREMVYSTGYFPHPDASLDEAQRVKLDLICRKLQLAPGHHLLDIGCGWGGLAVHAAVHFGATVHGVTLSQAQFDYATDKVARLGLQDRIKIELRDYRSVTGSAIYDAIAQVEMFEHVGIDNHERHFDDIRRLLKPQGMHFHQATVRRVDRDISEFRKVRPTMEVITRYIFPGGELDYIGLTVTNLGRLGFEVQDVENMREHYRMTLRLWAQRLYANMEAACQEIGVSRTRMWLLYLTLFAHGFKLGYVLCYQVVASRGDLGQSRMPLTRDHLKVSSNA